MGREMLFKLASWHWHINLVLVLTARDFWLVFWVFHIISKVLLLLFSWARSSINKDILCIQVGGLSVARAPVDTIISGRIRVGRSGSTGIPSEYQNLQLSGPHGITTVTGPRRYIKNVSLLLLDHVIAWLARLHQTVVKWTDHVDRFENCIVTDIAFSACYLRILHNCTLFCGFTTDMN